MNMHSAVRLKHNVPYGNPPAKAVSWTSCCNLFPMRSYVGFRPTAKLRGLKQNVLFCNFEHFWLGLCKCWYNTTLSHIIHRKPRLEPTLPFCATQLSIRQLAAVCLSTCMHTALKMHATFPMIEQISLFKTMVCPQIQNQLNRISGLVV